MTPRVEILVSQINKSGAVGVGIHYSLLVAGLEHVLDIYVVLSVPLTVGNFIIPTDELIFFSSSTNQVICLSWLYGASM